MKKAGKILILLHDIRSVHNVGSIFRSADCSGAGKIYLSGFSPTPLDRFGRGREDFAKVSLGAHNFVEWEYIENPVKLLKKLKKEGVCVVSVEQADNSINYKKIKKEVGAKAKGAGLRGGKSPDILLIFGNEVNGVSTEILKESDIIAEIPMKGQKESLNVSITAGIILFSL